MLPYKISRYLEALLQTEWGFNMINIKTSLFYAALAACLGTGYGAHYLVSQGDADRVRMTVPSVECEENSGKQKLDKNPRPLSRGQGF